MELKNEGPTECNILMVVMSQGKTNQHGRIDYGGCMRHKDVEICPIGALALHLFYRFDVLGEPFPDLSKRSAWYSTYLINGSDAKKEVSYSMQAGNMKKAMKACGIVSSKVTHSKRSSSTIIAETNGATEAQIRRLGRRNAEKMEGCYLTTLPKGAMRALAGFSSEGGSFALKRAVTAVPDALRAQIFPLVTAWTQPGRVEDIAGQGFVKLVLSLRDVVLQDSVTLKDKYANHPLWNHRVFKTPEYASYAATVREVCASPEEAVMDSVRRAMPVMANVLQSSFNTLGNRLGQLEKGMERIDGRLATIMTKGFKVVINDDVMAPAAPVSPPAPVAPPASVNVSEGHQDTTTIPQYRLSRNLSTMMEVWQEYKVGINGGPSVEKLEDAHGTQWRQAESERRYFSRRNVFYSAIKEIAWECNVSFETAVTVLEEERVNLRKTLDGMMKHIKSKGAVAIYSSRDNAI